VLNGWSVREVEERVRGDAPASRRPRTPKGQQQPTAQSADARRVEDALRRRLGTDVRLAAKRRGRGTLSISYYSNDDLARILELILGAPFDG
jgi:ParB family chromosome partitioning protein